MCRFFTRSHRKKYDPNVLYIYGCFIVNVNVVFIRKGVGIKTSREEGGNGKKTTKNSKKKTTKIALLSFSLLYLYHV